MSFGSIQNSLPLIYGTATSLGGWRRALDCVAESLEAKAISLKIRRPDPNLADLDMLSSAYLNFSRSPSGLYYGLRYAKLQSPDWKYLSTQTSHEPILDSALPIATDRLDQRGDYAFLRRKLGIRRRMGIRLNSDKVWFDAMSIAFDKRQGVIPQSAISTVIPLLPHMTKAVELSRIFSELTSRYKAALTALDHVKVGLAIALPNGEIIVENEEARRIFEKRDSIWRDRQGRPTCGHVDTAQEIIQTIRSVSETAVGQEAVSEHLMTLERRSSTEPLLLDVSPLKDSRAEIDTKLHGALLTILDPMRMPKIKIEHFVRLYGLTKAEAEVCRLILEGRSVSEIAEIRNTSPVTAKNQVASVLNKAGVSRRMQFIRLVMKVLPPIG